MGRLIDADFILNKMKTTDAQPATYSERYAWEFATVLLNNAPTVEAIQIPEDATNGDIIRKLFPRDYSVLFDRSVSSFWNSPYKEK